MSTKSNRKSKPVSFSYKQVYVDCVLSTVIVDDDALFPIGTRKLETQKHTGKLKLGRPQHTYWYPNLGSLPEQLYGPQYRYAQHIATDRYDLRKSSFRKSAKRLKLIGLE